MLRFLFKIIYLLGFLSPGVALAVGTAGQLASGLIVPVTIVASFISTISITIGISFIFAAILKYMQYRVNPLAVPISTVVFLLIMGVVLVCLPWAYKLTESGIAT